MKAEEVKRRAEIRSEVRQELAQREWTDRGFAEAMGINVDTVTDFLNGKTWPRRTTQARMGKVLQRPDLFDVGADGKPGAPLGRATDDPVVQRSVDFALAELLGSGNISLLAPDEIDEIRWAARTASLEQARKIFERPEVLERRHALGLLEVIEKGMANAVAVLESAMPADVDGHAELFALRDTLVAASKKLSAALAATSPWTISADFPDLVAALRTEYKAIDTEIMRHHRRLAAGETLPNALAVDLPLFPFSYAFDAVMGELQKQ